MRTQAIPYNKHEVTRVMRLVGIEEEEKPQTRAVRRKKRPPKKLPRPRPVTQKPRPKEDIYKEMFSFFQKVIESSCPTYTSATLESALVRNPQLNRLVNELGNTPGKLPSAQFIVRKAIQSAGYSNMGALKRAFPPAVTQNKRMLNDFYSRGCSICNETAKCCLRAHHTSRAQKSFAVSWNSAKEVLPGALRAEIAKCACVCLNCRSKIQARVIQQSQGLDSNQGSGEVARLSPNQQTSVPRLRSTGRRRYVHVR